MMDKDSELKYYKKKLSEAEKQLKIICDFTMDSGYWINQDNILVYQSPSIEIITGYKAEDFKNNHPDLFTSLIHPDDLKLFHSDFLENEGLGSEAPKVFRIINRKGKIRWLETLSQKIYDFDGTYLGIRGSTRDITDTKLKDLKIEESEERYRRISEVISDWAYSIRVLEDGSVKGEWVTEAYQKITGYHVNGVIPPEYWINIIHPDDREIIEKRQDRLTKRGLVSIDEYRIINSSGETIWIKDFGYPVFDPDGKRVIRVFGAAQDITKLKLSEGKLKQSLKEKEVLLKEIHHRIKNNLSMISALIHMQLENISDNNARNMLHKLENQVFSIGKIHEKLYMSDDLSTINLQHYVTELIMSIMNSFSLEDIEVQINIKNIFLSLDTALPIGLIINELTVNAIKHGFNQGDTNSLKVEISEDTSTSDYLLSFFNSCGPVSGSFNSHEKKSLGMELVSLLVQQIDGDLHISDANGFLVEIKFPS